MSPSHPRGDSACPCRSSAAPGPGNFLLLAIRRCVIVRWTTLRSAGWSVLQRGHDAVCRPRYPISPGSTDAPFALFEWSSDDPERVSVHSGLTPSTVPVGRSPMRRSHPLDASRIAGSAGRSVRRPRQPHRRERRLRHAHVPSGSKGRGTAGLAFTFPGRRASPTEGMNGQRDGCVRRTFGALAGYGVRIPRPSPGVRAPASDANSGSCVALADVWPALRPLQPRHLSPRCEQDVFTCRHPGSARSPGGGYGPVW